MSDATPTVLCVSAEPCETCHYDPLNEQRVTSSATVNGRKVSRSVPVHYRVIEQGRLRLGRMRDLLHVRRWFAHQKLPDAGAEDRGPLGRNCR